MNRTNQFISIVIPVLDEEGSIKELYNEICNALQNFSKWEIIFVDDGSKDNSVKIINELITEDPNVQLIKFYRNFGKAAALSEGFKYAKGEIIITMDADLQDDPFEIQNLINKINDDWDMVSGWKKKRNDPMSKTFPSKIFNYFTRLMTRVNIHDFNCGLKAYRSEVVKSIEIYGSLHRYIPALAKQKGFSVSEIEVNHRPRIHGETKYGGARYAEGFFDLITVLFVGKYTSRPLHFFGLIGMILILIGLGINVYLTIGWFKGVWIGNRPIFYLGILLLIVGVQFISIGLLGELMVKSSRQSEKRIESVITNSKK
ncbi:MAG: glycosyltransferase family 2 protein [Candidatus Marinimicrobia bacterium]|nr:glycosyltransferase family 2 protein [Candidatus Neomarinimicrobiota bacterium]MBL7023461.1 glycosyltransferase family 2 protein [Candidatus Neomarinimicrobiota bacterium]MBL7109284.1 glycosyltransferase family 2 protein [Candidatus Neomarinimicrobiota bacterium]